MSVLESEHLFEARLAYAVAFAAMNSHPQVDIEKASNAFGNLYSRALGAMPYIGAAMADGSATANAREEAVKKFRELQRRESK